MSRWLLDTVVISELRKAHRADSHILAWHEKISPRACYLSVITLAEIRIGIRKVEKFDPVFAQRLESWYRNQILVHFKDRLLPVNQDVSEIAAELISQHNMTPFDAVIGATARNHELTLVTRNIAHFLNTEIAVIDPWEPIS